MVICLSIKSSIVNRQQSTVNYQPSTVNSQQLTVNPQPLAYSLHLWETFGNSPNSQYVERCNFSLSFSPGFLLRFLQ
ncbi:MAG: hypothetical protein KME64_12115 [Scytonematopsis contorta HA4267-MV1]|nr:hypothetical protein [Scytonematopsis contorta HA4267-MV1]